MRFYADEKHTKIMGRTLWIDQTRYLGFSGSSIAFSFEGRKAQACIWSNPNAWGADSANLRGYVAVYVDDGKEPVRRICLDQEEGIYTLYEADESRAVTITVVKYSEAPFGKCGVRYLEIDTDKLLPAPAKKQRKMEIIGDSITCGYGVEADDVRIPFQTCNENPAKAYALRTAAALDADANLVSWSGNGLITKYVDENATEVLIDDWLMPTVYQYTDISGSHQLYGEEESKWEKWEFSRFVPDIILINLGTNDSSWCKEIPERRNDFYETYKRFVRDVRAKNPDAQILCMLGIMAQTVVRQVEQVVRDLSKETGDQKLHFLELPLQQEADGYVSDWHPSAKTYEKETAIVVKKVREIMGW